VGELKEGRMIHRPTSKGVIIDDAPPELDASNAARFETYLISRIDGLVNGESPPSVIVDLSQVEFMDSSGVRALIRAQQHASASEIRFRVRNPRPIVAKTLSLLRVFDLLVGEPPTRLERT
jgi:anti-sigma B factor antagonist